MPMFTNTSTAVFQDGDLLLNSGESVETDEPSRISQLRHQYAWQFTESATGDAPVEAEIKDELRAGGVCELREGGHVAINEDGDADAIVGDGVLPTKKSKK